MPADLAREILRCNCLVAALAIPSQHAYKHRAEFIEKHLKLAAEQLEVIPVSGSVHLHVRLLPESAIVAAARRASRIGVAELSAIGRSFLL